jgi:hypothetical protein
VRVVYIALKRHIPSHLLIANHRALRSYEGQLTTCYHCGEPGHLYQGCPNWRTGGGLRVSAARTWADIVAEGDTTVQLDDPPHSMEADGDRPQWKPAAEPLVQVTHEMPEGEGPAGPLESAPMEDGTGGATRAPRDGQDSPEMALEQRLSTDAPLELGMVERWDEKPPVREAVTPTAQRKVTGVGGKGGDQTGGAVTGPHAVPPVGEWGAALGRINKTTVR